MQPTLIYNLADTNNSRSNFWANFKYWHYILGQAMVVLLSFALPISTSASYFSIIIAWYCWLASSNWDTKLNIFKLNYSKYLLMFCVFSLISVCIKISANLSLFNLDFSHAARDLLKLLSIPVIAYFLLNKRVIKFVMLAFCLAMLVTLILAVGKNYLNWPIGLKYTTGGIFKSHIKTSFFMAISCFLLANYYLMTANLSKIIKFSIIAIITGMLYYLFFLNIGRIGYVTVFVLALIFAIQNFKTKGLIYGGLLALVGLILLGTISDLFLNRVLLLKQDLLIYQNHGDLLASSLGSRIEFALNSLKLIWEKPILGWGLGSFKSAYQNFIMLNYPTSLLTDNPHNEFLRVGVELGIIGLSLLVALIYQQFKSFKKLDQFNKNLAWGIIAAFWLGCIINSWLSDFTEGYFYCLFSACFLAVIYNNSFKSAERI